MKTYTIKVTNSERTYTLDNEATLQDIVAGMMAIFYGSELTGEQPTAIQITMNEENSEVAQ